MRIFVSYSRRDLDVVSRFVDDLTAKGYPVWFPEKELMPGPVEPQIEEAMSDSDVFLLCVGGLQNDLQSPVLASEKQRAIERSEKDPGFHVLCVILGGGQIPESFLKRDVIEFSRFKEWDQAIESADLILRKFEGL